MYIFSGFVYNAGGSAKLVKLTNYNRQLAGNSLILRFVMRDVIWTIIIIWLIYKLIDLFKAVNTKRTTVNAHTQHQGQSETTHHPNKDIKEAVRRHINKTGEYVDFEEVK